MVVKGVGIDVTDVYVGPISIFSRGVFRVALVNSSLCRP